MRYFIVSGFSPIYLAEVEEIGKVTLVNVRVTDCLGGIDGVWFLRGRFQTRLRIMKGHNLLP